MLSIKTKTYAFFKSTWFFLAAVFFMLFGAQIAWSSPSESLIRPAVVIPQPALDLSDLDVRDAQNRKVASVTKQNELRRLFEFGLSGLILNNLTPSKQTVQNVLSHTWNVSFGWLQKAAGRLLTALIGWMGKNKWARIFIFVRSHFTDPLSVAGTLTPARISFHSLIPTLLSSTILLR